MAVITYEAVDRGALLPGHSAGTSYSFEIPFSKWDVSEKDSSVVSRPLDGARHSVYFHTIEFYDFAFVPTDDQALLDQFEEFRTSTRAFEAFSIDFDGTILSPDNPIMVVKNGPIRRQRVNQTEFVYSGQVEVI